MHHRQTAYGKIKFKSSTDARWAIFFDTLHVKWEYHKQEFDLPYNSTAIPDFYLEGIGWFEVRNETPDIHDLTMCRALAVRTQECVFIASGAVPACENITGFKVRMRRLDAGENEINHGQCDRCGGSIIDEQEQLQWCVCERCGEVIISDGESQSFEAGCTCENGNIVDYLHGEACCGVDKEELLSIISKAAAAANSAIF